MYLKFALVASLALTGLAGLASRVQEPQVSADQVVGGPTAVASSFADADASATTAGTGTDLDGISLESRDLVVPSVEASGRIDPSDVPAVTASADVVVADQLVSPERLESEVMPVDGFQTLGVTWPDGAAVGDLGGQVRTETDGTWSAWVDLTQSDDAPDAGTADAASSVRGGTDSVAIGDVDAVQLSFAATTEGGPDGLSLALIGSSEQTAADDVVGSAASGGATIRSAAYMTAADAPSVLEAAVGPRVISRVEWGAPAQVCTPDVASTLVGAVVHHTAGSNAYASVAQAMQQIRNDAAYHISGRGWCDIGYNFIVDKWGNIYEGRANSLTQAVIGVHDGGFNAGTVGVSMLGTYDAVPSLATQQGVAQIIGWRLGAYGIDPRGAMTYWTGAGENSRFTNQTVSLPRVFGHRDTAFTACPGNGGYAALPSIRQMAFDSGYALRFLEAQSVVKALYADILLRSVDPAGLQTWSAMLASGSGGPALVGSLTNSQEYLQLRIALAYREVLGREPEPAGMADWIAAIRAGRASVDDVKRRFYDSNEYYNRSGGSPEGYIDLLYRTAFNRPATAGESAYWSGQIGVVGRSRVVDGIWYSMEAALYRAGNYYQVFLKRAPDPAGQQMWAVTLLIHGEGAVRMGIAGSEEYRLLAAVRFP